MWLKDSVNLLTLLITVIIIIIGVMTLVQCNTEAGMMTMIARPTFGYSRFKILPLSPLPLPGGRVIDSTVSQFDRFLRA